MRKSTRIMLVVPLLSLFIAWSLSALADDHTKSTPKVPATQLKTDKGTKTVGAGAKGFSGGSKPDSAADVGGAVGGTVGDAVGGAVGGTVGGAVGGFLNGAFGPR